MHLVAFTGRAGSGKDTAARGILERIPTAETFAFATELKEVAARLYGLTPAQLHGLEKEVVDPRWGLTPRQILQRLGTEVVRSVHPDTWVRALFERELADCPHVEVAVITDARRRNEVAAVRARGGVVIRVVRPGLVPDSGMLRLLARWPRLRTWWLRWVWGDHASEAEIDVLPVDHEVVNDGTVEDLQRLVLQLLNEEHGIGPARD